MKLLLIFILFNVSMVTQPNSTLTKNEYNSEFPDTTKVKVISVPNESWWHRNEGTFLGAFFAGIIALISVLLTNYYSNKAKSAREEEVYCGLLFAIKTELEYHHKGFPHLIQELQAIMQRSLDIKDIVIDKPSRDISIQLLKEIRSKILSLENYNTNVFRAISAYINKCELINSDIELERIIRLNQKIPNEVTFEDSTRGYFNVVIEQIENVSSSIQSIFNIINSDLSSLGRENKHPGINELNSSKPAS